jgi:hypothetical protein
MQTVIPAPRAGQGSVPSCVYAPFQQLIPPEPALNEAWPPEEADAQETPERPEAASSLLRDRALAQLHLPPHLAFEPRADHSEEERVLRSLSRRAARVVRPLIQSIPQHELWVMGFDESCRPVGLQRLVPGPQGQTFATVPLVLSWAETTGARAVVLVQNQPGPRRAATPVELFPSLKLAAAAALLNLILVDHIVIHGGGAPTLLRERSVLPEVQTLAADLRTSIEALSSVQRRFGVPRPPEAPAGDEGHRR